MSKSKYVVHMPVMILVEVDADTEVEACIKAYDNFGPTINKGNLCGHPLLKTEIDSERWIDGDYQVYVKGEYDHSLVSARED